MNCIIRVAKTKALISFAVTAKLICAFVFAYADCCFSHAAAQFIFFLCGLKVFFIHVHVLIFSQTFEYMSQTFEYVYYEKIALNLQCFGDVCML